MKELVLKGSFYDMGIKYGEACKKEIKLFIKVIYFMVSISKKPGSTAFTPNMMYLLSTMITLRGDKKRFKESLKGFEENITKYFPQALEMIRGISEGSQCDYEDVLFLNIAVDVLLNCSCWGASGSSTIGNKVLIGMNADEEKMTQKYEVMVHMKPNKGYEVKGTAMMGSVCLNHGMNETGFSLASHLYFLKSEGRNTQNIPIFIMTKALYACKSIEEAVKLYEGLPNIDIGAVFYIGDANQLLKIECSSEERIYDYVKDGVRGTTNLPAAPSIEELDIFRAYKDNQNMNALYREKRMEYLLKKYDGKIDIETMIAIATDHGDKDDETNGKSICQHGKIKTVVSYIADPQNKTMYIYEGNPCEDKVKIYNF